MSLSPKPGHVTVRMYNVGFGDAFLIVFPDDQRVLIDCGMHPAGRGPRAIEEVVESILADVSDDDGARIDVVVCTHRHRDHVSGFDNPLWREVEVGEVWMPWTEDPRDPEAARIREGQAHLAAALNAALADGAAAAPLALNSLPNAEAMDTLHNGFAGNPRRRFFPGGDDVVSELECESLNLADVRVRVLGPSREEKVIRDVDPPSGAAYLRVASDGDVGSEASPFADSWELTSDELAGDDGLEHLRLTDEELARIREAADGDLFGTAVALEKAINGTSLVLCFDLGDARLLFPADAQWGTWERIIDDAEASALVERVNLLKVGHHGSHNATPKAFVELLARRPRDLDLWAMVPTRPIEIWPKIPKSELLDALAEVTPRIARSDKGAGPPARGFDRWDEQAIDVQIPI